MKYQAVIEIFKLYDPRIPDSCLEDLDRAMQFYYPDPDQLEECITILEQVIERYSSYLSAESLAEIFLTLGHSYLTTNELDKSRDALLSVMEMRGLDDFYYGNAQLHLAQVELDKGNYDKALAIIESADKSYRYYPIAYNNMRKIIAQAKLKAQGKEKAR